jgi:hypothetical protein
MTTIKSSVKKVCCKVQGDVITPGIGNEIRRAITHVHAKDSQTQGNLFSPVYLFGTHVA